MTPLVWTRRAIEDVQSIRQFMAQEIRRSHMGVLSSKSGNVLIVTPQEKLDTNTAPNVDEVISENIESGETKIVFDLSQIAYISSMGLRVILKTVMTMMRKDGKVALCGGNDQVLNVLQLSGAMISTLHVPTLDEAVQKIQS